MVNKLQKAVNKRAVPEKTIKNVLTITAKHALIPMNLEGVETQTEILSDAYRKLEELQDDIYEECQDPDELEKYQDEFEDLQRVYADARTKLKQIAKSLTPASTGPPPVVPTGTSAPAATVKLPTLALQKFDGDVQAWPSFADLFKAGVDSIPSLKNSQKLQYLKGHLEGKALSVVESVTITDANYQKAWSMLEERFNNQREILYSHLSRLYNIKHVQPSISSSLQELVDTVNDVVGAFLVLSRKVNDWDDILVFMILQKLNYQLKRDWERTLTDKQPPTFKAFMEFLTKEARANLICSNEREKFVGTKEVKGKPSEKPADKGKKENPKKSAATHHGTTTSGCSFCGENHSNHECDVFLKMKNFKRYETMKKKGICFNCLEPGHRTTNCTRKGCSQCEKKHHPVLHQNESKTESESKDEVSTHHAFNGRETQVLLGTVLVNVPDCYGKLQVCRALVDSGSMSTLITEECVRKLGLKRTQETVEITGIFGAVAGSSKASVHFKIFSLMNPNYSLDVDCLVLPKVTSDLPKLPFIAKKWSHIEALKLADPKFNQPGKIEMLLGAEVFAEVVVGGRVTGEAGAPVALYTHFGWMLTGKLTNDQEEEKPKNVSVSVNISLIELDNTMKKFWELEEVPRKQILTAEEKRCEEHFMANYRREVNGRFIVRLPLKEGKPFGNSREAARRRLNQVEKKLAANPDLKKQYDEFMQEYLELGHMEEVSPEAEVLRDSDCYYLPHHAVIKDASTTTKCRVVFDASSKSSTGVSLNDRLMDGPKLQQDLAIHLMRWRIHLIVVKADAAKMYRQVRVDQKDVNWQRILWRDSEGNVKSYNLLTVTYGEKPSGFLAIRSMNQLATLEAGQYPRGAEVILRDMYVDDEMSGGQTEEEVILVQNQIRELLAKGCFQMRKFSSNSENVLKTIPEELRETQVPLKIDAEESLKTLGLLWHPTLDCFMFKVNLEKRSKFTKRNLLSDMSKVFDPLGLLAPVTLTAKIIFQELWKHDLGWDDPLPAKVEDQWSEYLGELESIENLRIERCVTIKNANSHQIHGFCDASEVAFSACVYVVSSLPDGQFYSRLIASKTRVAPIRKVTLPRLELCGAVLLSRLIAVVQDSMPMVAFEEVHAWTDSTVALAWIQGNPQRWKTFVANRVVEIQDSIPIHCWHHIAGTENPADCASRGLRPSDLEHHPLWWTGPAWIGTGNYSRVPIEPKTENEIEVEERKTTQVNLVEVDTTLIERFSSFLKLARFTAIMLRFGASLKRPMYCGPLTIQELEWAEKAWIRLVQRKEFDPEITALKKGQQLHSKSKLLQLNPFLDDQNLLRVGGRLRHANLPFSKKRPILLPASGHLTKLIVEHYHQISLHGGAQLTLNCLHWKYWIPSGRRFVQGVIRKCMVCARQKAEVGHQLMGDLPSDRVTPGRVFESTGVDFAGPFILKISHGRKAAKFKGYVALFICFATKAIHLEAVSDLTSEAFIAALRRFVGRRPGVRTIYSDCGTNFVGANKELKRLASVAILRNDEKLVHFLEKRRIVWKFNPPSAPHFGGLWEAGVKSAKHHLKRVLGDTILTFEEMATILVQVEACLNSRPITEISTSPDDPEALTPGHFLAGGPMLSLTEPDLIELSISRLNRWQLMQRMVQDFWRRWTSEYLSTLQKRNKWRLELPNLKPGAIVLIKDDRLPPLKWRLGRILKCHPGEDGKVRVVTVKIAEGVYKRSIVKICPMPIDINESEN